MWPLRFLRASHDHDEPFTVRDGINVARYALKRLVQDAERDPVDAIAEAVKMTLGEEGLLYLLERDPAGPRRPIGLDDDPADPDA